MELVRAGLAGSVGERSIRDGDDGVADRTVGDPSKVERNVALEEGERVQNQTVLCSESEATSKGQHELERVDHDHEALTLEVTTC